MKMFCFQKLFAAALAAVAILIVSSALSVQAVTTNTVEVGQGGLVFVPATNHINVNDVIVWHWDGNNHSTTSDTGIWDSSVHNTPFSFTNSFPNAGTFPFKCSVHVSFGMVGEVDVAAVVHTPPTVTITNPAASAVFSAPANVTIKANPQDSDGTVTNVAFFVDNGLVANVKTAPFTTTANSLAAGSHLLTAIATDDSATTGTNSVTISVVTPVAVNLTQSKFSAGTSFSFLYSVNTGLDYVVLRTTNLAPVTWVPLSTNQATTNPSAFTDPNTPAGPAYYRVGLLPNP